ncbi:MAG TPA: hypothetical protein VMC85_08265 [Desulfomonilaceae bacterium]|nr:hypothetical protein [Desulfomonilaceae bacterium]
MKGILFLAVLLFILLIPFFGYAELWRVMGADNLKTLFFQSRAQDR